MPASLTGNTCSLAFLSLCGYCERSGQCWGWPDHIPDYSRAEPGHADPGKSSAEWRQHFPGVLWSVGSGQSCCDHLSMLRQASLPGSVCVQWLWWPVQSWERIDNRFVRAGTCWPNKHWGLTHRKAWQSVLNGHSLQFSDGVYDTEDLFLYWKMYNYIILCFRKWLQFGIFIISWLQVSSMLSSNISFLNYSHASSDKEKVTCCVLQIKCLRLQICSIFRILGILPRFWIVLPLNRDSWKSYWLKAIHFQTLWLSETRRAASFLVIKYNSLYVWT